MLRFAKLCLASMVVAVGSVHAYTIKKIHQPYIDVGVQAVNYQHVWWGGQLDNSVQGLLRLGYGQALDERFALYDRMSFYVNVLAEQEDFDLNPEFIEVGFKFQLTDQRKQQIDYGFLFEYGRSVHDGINEFRGSLLLNGDMNQSFWTANITALYEAGSDSENEYDFEASAKWVYRASPQLEPRVEIHIADETLAIGPGVGGFINMNQQNKLDWSVSYLRELDNDALDYALNLHVSYQY